MKDHGEGSALAKPKKEAAKPKEHEGGGGEKSTAKKVHHMEIHPSHSGGHIAVHKHMMGGEGPPPEDEMHAVAPGGMDAHLAAHMPGGAAPEMEPEGGEEEAAGGAGGGGGAPMPGM